MLKKLTFILLVMSFLMTINAQSKSAKTEYFGKAPAAAMDNNDAASKSFSNTSNTQAATAILIGKMWNAYSTQASYTNQIYYDPYSNLLAIIKRNDRTGAGSGRIVYQISDDLGQNWTGQIGPLNEPFGYVLGRHPNVAITNQGKSADDFANIFVVGSWAELGASWRYYGFAADAAAAESPVFYDDSVYFPGDEMFVNNAGHVYTVIALGEYDTTVNDPANQHLFVSQDNGTTWSKSPISYVSDFFDDTFNGTKSDIAANGTGYILVDAQEAAGAGVYDFAWKKTTDDGATFDADWTWVHFWDAEFGTGKLGDVIHAVNYEIDFITGKDGQPFIAGTFVDTVDGTNSGIYVLTNAGAGWVATKIAAVNATSLDLAGGLSTLNEVEFARSEDGLVIGLKYADLPAPDATNYDTFVSWFNGSMWTDPVNITETADENEVYSQLASRIYSMGNDEYQMFPMYSQFGADDLSEASLFLLDGVTATVVPDWPTSVDDNLTVSNFELSQNYPNPFNPTTKISYSVADQSMVTLKVYDVLGKEVATLVNEVKAAGQYDVSFNAANLATGMYIYKLQAGEFVSSKKMMLVK